MRIPPLVQKLLVTSLLVAGCSSGKEKPDEKPTAPPARPAFENPGGMWTPEQLTEHAETLKSLGLELEPSVLSNPMGPVLGAVVSLGGCSASFVSNQGLLVTNHHCVQGALQQNATPEKNLIKDGFLAATRADEVTAGPTARVFVTQSFKDITAQMTDGLTAIADDVARYKTLETRQKEAVAACEKDRPGIRCNVARYYEGAQFILIEQLEIRDIRLVYAPNAGIGNYGGEVDNWRWPRHTGDFSFLRAYVAPDGKSADFSPANVPFQPRHFLKVAQKPLKTGDLVFVAGYPGRTNRLKTAAEVKEAVEWFYPRRVQTFEMYIKLLEELSKTDKDIAIKGNGLLRGLNNYLTNTKGQLDGLVQGGLMAQKQQQEAELRTWMDAQESRKQTYAGVFEKMVLLEAELLKNREKDASLTDAVRFVRMPGVASMLVRMAEERVKPDAQRHPDFQERNWQRMEQSLQAMEKSYNSTMDRAMLVATLKRVSKLPAADQTELLGLVLGKTPPSDDAIVKAVDALYAKTTLEDVKVRISLLKSATTEELKKSKDPFIALGLQLRPLLKSMEDREEKYVGGMSVVRPRYIEALRAWSKTPVSSDANGTLRITYGTVRGYKPNAEAAEFTPFTTLTQVVAKNTNAEPFAVPPKLLDAVNQKKLGPYVDEAVKDVPVDFLADLHITGGNSGSATLNARGELVGVVFDGNIESMASDWVFIPSITRSIHVDIRYMAWVMDAVDGADHLLTEMGMTPSVP